MPSRIFQSVILQLKECTAHAIGVIDGDGAVIACTDSSLLSERYPAAVDVLISHEGAAVQVEDKVFKGLSGWNLQPDYAAFVVGEGQEAETLCALAAVALSGAKANYEEKHDRATFVKNIILDNILLGDIYVRARELHFEPEVNRAVFLVRQLDEANPTAVDVLAGLFPDRQVEFVLSINDSDVAVIKEIGEEEDTKELQQLAAQMQALLEKELGIRAVVGIGTIAPHLRDLARAYKEAGVAIEVGKVFNTDKTIITYENLGIGRLIYQLPTTLCEMFLQEVFKKNPIDALDQETLFTINRFFENSLNVSETARKIFVHRNTLVYRLEKIKKLTGLDLREFDDAITFKVALMVKKYLVSRGIDN